MLSRRQKVFDCVARVRSSAYPNFSDSDVHVYVEERRRKYESLEGGETALQQNVLG